MTLCQIRRYLVQIDVQVTFSWVGTPLVIPPSIIIILYFTKMLTWQLKEFYLTADMRSIVISLQPQLSFITLPTDSLSLSNGNFLFLKKFPAQEKIKRWEVDLRPGRGKELGKLALNKNKDVYDWHNVWFFPINLRNHQYLPSIILKQSHHKDKVRHISG